MIFKKRYHPVIYTLTGAWIHDVNSFNNLYRQDISITICAMIRAADHFSIMCLRDMCTSINLLKKKIIESGGQRPPVPIFEEEYLCLSNHPDYCTLF